jgi:DNA-binding XRE family transcriptional regulator
MAAAHSRSVRVNVNTLDFRGRHSDTDKRGHRILGRPRPPGASSMKANSHHNGLAVKRVTVQGKPMIMLEEAEFERLLHKADEWEPPLPEPDSAGNYSALEYSRVSLARKIIRDRRRLGLPQAELGRRAGIRPETLNRIEHGQHAASVATVEKIDRGLKEVEKRA